MQRLIILFIAFVALGSAAAAEPVAIRTDDVARFYAVVDAAGGKPTAEVLQRDYLDAGSDGVRQFIPQRILSAEALAKKVAEKPDIYARARACAAQLPEIASRVAAAHAELKALYPQAVDPKVTILIGRNNSGGTTGSAGVLIGLEVMCSADHLQADLSDRLTHMIVHEMAHVEQMAANAGRTEAPVMNLLMMSMGEGTADFIAELTSGSVSNAHLLEWTKGREAEIAKLFLADAESTDPEVLGRWLYNGVGTPEKPGDLGYWAGYRIAKAYYEQAPDKAAALKALLEMRDPNAILDQSGWGR